MTVAGVYVLRRRGGQPVAVGAVPTYTGYKTPFYPITPAVFLAMVSVVLVLIALNNIRQSVKGTVVVLLGIPAYYLFFKRTDSTKG